MENCQIVNIDESSTNNWMTVTIGAVIPAEENQSYVPGEETIENLSEICGVPLDNSSEFLLLNVEKEQSQHCGENQDEENLRKLLKEFDLEPVFEYLKAAQVTFRSLQFMQKEDIMEAIPPLGLRMEFREKLFVWKKKQFGIDEGTMSMPSKVEDWLQTVQYPKNSSLNSSSANLSNCSKLLNKELRVILNETSKGKNIIEFYNQKNNLTNVYRNELINIIVEEVITNNITLHAKDFLVLINEIVGIFPNEKAVEDYYFIPRKGRKNPSGKLYAKYKNRRSKIQKLLIDELEKTDSDKDSSTETLQANRELLDETDKSTLLVFKTFLSRDSSDWNEVCEKWKFTFKMRQQNFSILA